MKPSLIPSAALTLPSWVLIWVRAGLVARVAGVPADGLIPPVFIRNVILPVAFFLAAWKGGAP